MSTVHKRKFHYIYKITRFDGAYYIGMHSTDDLADGYFGSGQRLWKSIKYHGKEKHTLEILEFIQSRLDLVAREKALVTEEMIRDKLCLNLCIGGGYVHRAPDHPDGAKNKSKAAKAHYASDAGQVTKAKLSALHTGRKCTAETKANMGVAAKERMKKMKADGSWELVKEKNAETHRGKTQTAETIMKRVNSVQAYKDANGGKRAFSEQARANISASLVGSSRNAKTHTLITLDGEENIIQNLTRWLRDNDSTRGSGKYVRDNSGKITHHILKPVGVRINTVRENDAHQH